MDDLVNLADIGRMLDVSRQRAAMIAEQAGFPAPVGQMGRGRVWKRADVDKWARKSGRLS